MLRRRFRTTSDTRAALGLAAAGYAGLVLVPFLKYPPNPPAVGDPDTIGDRTLLYLTMVWISVLAAVAALRLRRTLAERRPGSNATLIAIAAYLAVVVIAGLALPGIHEIPKDFPATTLWRFREASVGTQLVMWATIGLAFATMAERAMTGRPILSSRLTRSGATAPAGE